MMMSRQMQEHIAQEFSSSPLGENDIRRVEGAGELWVARNEVPEAYRDTDGCSFIFLWAYQIAGELYRFHRRM